MEKGRALIEIKNLSVDYKVKEGYLSAVKNADLTINKGEIFALIGESGCGKSTIAYTIMKLLFSENERVSGEILFEGRDLLKATEREMEDIRGRDIGMIFQNPLDSLNPVYRSADQVAEAIMLDGIDRKQAWNKVLELYRSVRIPDSEKRMKSFPHELSGGMRQRVMIAMMLARNPKLLIADEPTTALDVTIEAQILSIIRGLRAQFDTSILIITHNFGIVAEVADKIAVMYAGEIVELGDVFQIFSAPMHPYTRALMLALPRVRKHERRLATIPGSVPKLIGDIPGCRFANRCACAADVCASEAPPLRTAKDGHIYRCHREAF
ncbi:MAG TPA: ABC transporter ATP-binding protein [Clostridia bacterium]|nr:ABC transporter ATP-binding protein [Clostridia bacterium]